MTAVTSPPVVDGDALMGFVFRAIDEVGASLNCALVVMGDRLGYYRALAEQGPLAPNALADLTNTAEPASGSPHRRLAGTSATTPRPSPTRSPPRSPSR